MLNREQILNAQDILKKEVAVSEWGGSVIVKGLTAKERDHYEQSLINMHGKNVTMNYENAKAKLVVLSTIDEAGNKLFEEADIEALGEKSASAVNKLYDVATELSGLKAEEVEDLVKN